MHGPLRSSDLIRIFHSHFGKSREKPYEKRGANTFECVVEKTRHAGLETCDTTLECRCVSRRIVARFQRLMATVAAHPGRCPGLSCCGLSGLVFAPPFGKKEAMDLPLRERLRGCDTAGWEACATTLEYRLVSRRIVARLQRLMATVTANPGRCPGLSCGGL